MDGKEEGRAERAMDGALGAIGFVAFVAVCGFFVTCGGVILAIAGVTAADFAKAFLYVGIFATIGLFMAASLDMVNSSSGPTGGGKRNFMDFLWDHQVLKFAAFASFASCSFYFLGSPDDRTFGQFQSNLFFLGTFALLATYLYDLGPRKPKPATGKRGKNFFDFRKRSRDDLVESAIERTDVSDLERVRFVTNGGESFSIDTDKMKRIAKLVCTKLGKTRFSAEELRGYFERFVTSARSELPPEMVEKIVSKMEEFVSSWGNVEFVKRP